MASTDFLRDLDRVLNRLAACNASIGGQMIRGEDPNPVQLATMRELQLDLAITLDQVSKMVQNMSLDATEQTTYEDAVQTFCAIILGHRLNLLILNGERNPFTRLIAEVHGNP